MFMGAGWEREHLPQSITPDLRVDREGYPVSNYEKYRAGHPVSNYEKVLSFIHSSQMRADTWTQVTRLYLIQYRSSSPCISLSQPSILSPIICFLLQVIHCESSFFLFVDVF